ncbi:type II CRISPR RNA-guided endonuclease Cas9 [Anaeromusa acidaminophila]|uniref:type II CRISPR RNA-guided endonuclease Cas9 n=1 Tax=Anaeromusa acidaminophila TaxID=81464 RepID=UPI00036673BF|nr:type II CRISPR RNA-guided endonuclease Cas9 [Anaeromusa acidaminophila]
MNYTIGLDIGVASIGWAVIDNDNKRIVALNENLFDKAEDYKGKSKAEVRREKSSRSKTVRRKAHRLIRVRRLFVNTGLLTKDIVTNFHFHPSLLNKPNDLGKRTRKSPYQLRAEGLDRCLSNIEWAVVLFHLAKHRSFISVDTKDENAQKMKKAINENRSLLTMCAYRTVGEMYYKDDKFKEKCRNKGGEFTATINRQMLLDELTLLFEAQRSFGNQYSSVEFQQKYVTIFSSQRPTFTNSAIEKMVGYCTFEPHQKRAPKNSYTVERFNLLRDLSQLKYMIGIEEFFLTMEEKQAIIDLAYSKEKVTYSNIRTILNKKFKFPPNAIFKGHPIDKEQKNFTSLKGYHTLKKALSPLGANEWNVFSQNYRLLDQTVESIALGKNEANIIKRFKKIGLPPKYHSLLCNVSFSKFSHLSFKALNNILPLMESGMTYTAACANSKYKGHYIKNTQIQKTDPLILPLIPQTLFSNPVVFRALCKTRRIVQAIIKRYGLPYAIHLETARELSNSDEKKKEIEEQQNKNRKATEILVKELKEFGITTPKYSLIEKYRYYKEQDGICPYSGEPINLDMLLSDLYGSIYEIDHIIPYSLTQCNERSNKVLVKQSENQNKSNRLPIEYLGRDKERWDRFCTWVKGSRLSVRKKQTLLREPLTKEESECFRTRNLTDTQYAATAAAEYLKVGVTFSDKNNRKPIVLIKGAVTGFLRYNWGIKKDREKFLQHAQDAAVVAVASEKMLQQISEYYKLKETQPQLFYNKDNRPSFPMPWPFFNNELKARLSANPVEKIAAYKRIHKIPPVYYDEDISCYKPLYPSIAVRYKINGCLLDETAQSALPKYIKEGYTIKKIPLTELEPKHLIEDKDGIIPVVGADKDVAFREALLKRFTDIISIDEYYKKSLTEIKKISKQAFTEKFFKPSKPGRVPSLVKSIRIIDKGTAGHIKNNALYKNGTDSLFKVSIFKKNESYYFVPHYRLPALQKKEVLKAIVPKNSEENWIPIDETFHRCFSLYKNNLVRLITVRGEEHIGYYKGTHRRINAINLLSKETSFSITAPQIKYIELLFVSVLGDITRSKGDFS